jgi:hypothetical protein
MFNYMTDLSTVEVNLDETRIISVKGTNKHDNITLTLL